MIYGLTNKQVQEKVKLGLVNKIKKKDENSYFKIFQRNIFTFFNLINIILAFLVFITGSYRNMLFLGTVLTNCIIGIFQECKAKKLLDKIAFKNISLSKVIRENKTLEIQVEDIVLDEYIILKTGDLIMLDGQIVDGEALINESIITGEADDILKQKDDFIYGGSYLTSGEIIYQVKKIKNQNYINTIVNQAKQENQNKQPSMLKRLINKVLKYVSFALVPIAVSLFLKQMIVGKESFNDNILKMVSAVVGMIPEGLVLLVSIALTIASIKLAKEKVLVQELYSLENLSRCDVICLDKTGTITTGNMKVLEVVNLQDSDVSNIIANIAHFCNDQNATSNALKEYFKVEDNLNIDEIFHFSSTTKCSGIKVENNKYLIGAFSFLEIQNNSKEIEAMVQEYSHQGNRVLALTNNAMIMALVILEDEIKTNIKEIINYFRENKVDIKVISGDDPITVSAIMRKLEYENASNWMDCSKEEEIDNIDINNCSIFGRTTPIFKRKIIKKLQDQGKVVAMTGDGVNDIAALKQADFSISFNNAHQMTKHSSHVVLLDDDFAHLTSIVNQGRQVFNNIINTTTLFLCKTFLSILLSIITIFFGQSYPFDPIQLTLVSTMCIGFYAFVLTLTPNYQKITKGYLYKILYNIIPFEISFLLIYIVVDILNYRITTYSLILVYVNYLIVMYKLSKPFNFIKIISYLLVLVSLPVSYLFFNNFFALESLNKKELINLLILSVIMIVIQLLCIKLLSFFTNKEDSK